jgi:hypothetical protein
MPVPYILHEHSGAGGADPTHSPGRRGFLRNFGHLQAARGWQYFAGRLVSNQSPQLAESCDRQQNVRLRWQRQPPTVTGFMAP